MHDLGRFVELEPIAQDSGELRARRAADGGVRMLFDQRAHQLLDAVVLTRATRKLRQLPDVQRGERRSRIGSGAHEVIERGARVTVELGEIGCRLVRARGLRMAREHVFDLRVQLLGVESMVVKRVHQSVDLGPTVPTVRRLERWGVARGVVDESFRPCAHASSPAHNEAARTR